MKKKYTYIQIRYMGGKYDHNNTQQVMFKWKRFNEQSFLLLLYNIM